jgi:cysteine desulfurase
VPGIAGMAAALRLLREEGLLCATPAAAVAAHFEAGLGAIEGVRVHGAGAPRVGNTVSVGLSGALGEVVVAALDLHGIAAATGAACSSGSTAPSPGLLALGLSRDEAREVVRFSFGRGSSTADADSILGILPEVLARARRYR